MNGVFKPLAATEVVANDETSCVVMHKDQEPELEPGSVLAIEHGPQLMHAGAEKKHVWTKLTSRIMADIFDFALPCKLATSLHYKYSCCLHSDVFI